MATTSDAIVARINELQKKAELKENEARLHEDAARKCREERNEAKLAIVELRKDLVDVTTMTKAQEALEAAQQAKTHAEQHAAALAEGRKAAAALQADLTAMKVDLQAKLDALNVPEK